MTGAGWLAPPEDGQVMGPGACVRYSAQVRALRANARADQVTGEVFANFCALGRASTRARVLARLGLDAEAPELRRPFDLVGGGEDTRWPRVLPGAGVTWGVVDDATGLYEPAPPVWDAAAAGRAAREDGHRPLLTYPLWKIGEDGPFVVDALALDLTGPDRWWRRTGLVPVAGLGGWSPGWEADRGDEVRLFARPADWILAGGDGCAAMGVGSAGWLIVEPAAPEARQIYRMIGAGELRVICDDIAHAGAVDDLARPRRKRATYQGNIKAAA